jgi:hypothetical protein
LREVAAEISRRDFQAGRPVPISDEKIRDAQSMSVESAPIRYAKLAKAKPSAVLDRR